VLAAPTRATAGAQPPGDAARVPRSAPPPGSTPQPPPPPLAPPPPPPEAYAGAGKAYRTALRALSNLPLALGEMATLAALSAIGTVIEQNKARAHAVAPRTQQRTRGSGGAGGAARDAAPRARRERVGKLTQRGMLFGCPARRATATT
jgi:hypothetical protein